MDPGETRLIKPITEVQTLHVSAHMVWLQESRYQGVSEAAEQDIFLGRCELRGMEELFEESYEEVPQAGKVA